MFAGICKWLKSIDFEKLEAFDKTYEEIEGFNTVSKVNKILYAYDIKNNVVDENSKEILTQSNNLIYEKIKSHFKINLQK